MPAEPWLQSLPSLPWLRRPNARVDRYWRDHIRWNRSITSYGGNGFTSTLASARALPKGWAALNTSVHGSPWLRNYTNQSSYMLDVSDRVVVVGSFAVVITSNPVAVVDMAGGCCRAAPPIAFSKLQQPNAAKIVHTLRNLPRDTVEHAWLFLAYHSHSSSFFHAVAESATKLVYGMRLLQQQREIKVLHASGHVHEILGVLGMEARSLPQGTALSGMVFARRITIPPFPDNRLPRALRDELRLRVLRGAPPSNDKSRGIIVIRRSALPKYGGRAMLNHNELMFTLRHYMVPQSVKLTEWPPDGTLTEAMRTWATHDVAICQHGAGCTNMLFMPSGSTVIEIAAVGQQGMVYGSMARTMNHRYILCRYTRDGSGTSRLSLPVGVTKDTSRVTAFNYNMTSFLECISDFVQAKYGHLPGPV